MVMGSDEQNRIGPDFFAFYVREVSNLLSQDEGLLPSISLSTEAGNMCPGVLENGKGANGSSDINALFSDSIGIQVLDRKRELLKTMLRQCVRTLVHEVDEIVDPVVRARQILNHIRYKQQHSRLETASAIEAMERPHKKLKISPSSSTADLLPYFTHENSGSGKEIRNANGLVLKKGCTSSPDKISSLKEGKDSSEDDNSGVKKENESIPNGNSGLKKGMYSSPDETSILNTVKDSSPNNKSEHELLLMDKTKSEVVKKCALCESTEPPQWRYIDRRRVSMLLSPSLFCSVISKYSYLTDILWQLCNACGLRIRKGKAGPSDGICKVSEHLKNLLEDENDPLLEKAMQKCSGELSSTLHHMEQHLEELLDTVISKCRLMTCPEKQHLWKSIHKLPPKNLDRIVEIIQRSKPVENEPYNEIFVNLENQDNVTLWRLYFYVKAVENARKLSV